ncbi:MAG: LacI family DNA-binding transcriptional regulator [Chloroflexota bacterium]|nr:LacI family DNA-binding transcriptional regulator [Chloroflexota bacterium]
MAKEASVSPATASMALNGRANVNRDTRRRVEEAAARLRYAGARRAGGIESERSRLHVVEERAVG